MMLKYFSAVVSGIGWILCTLGSIFFLLTFHYKLHSIKEPAVPRKNNSIVGLFPKVTFAIVVGIIFVSQNSSPDGAFQKLYFLPNFSQFLAPGGGIDY